MNATKENVLHTICNTTPFAYSELSSFYDEFKSIDLLIAAVESCSSLGLRDLHDAQIVQFLKSNKFRDVHFSAGGNGDLPDIVRVFVLDKEIYRWYGSVEQIQNEKGEK